MSGSRAPARRAVTYHAPQAYNERPASAADRSAAELRANVQQVQDTARKEAVLKALSQCVKSGRPISAELAATARDALGL